jgi:hypothetical protein
VLSLGVTVTYSEGCQAAEANRLFSIFAKRVFLVSLLEG